MIQYFLFLQEKDYINKKNTLPFHKPDVIQQANPSLSSATHLKLHLQIYDQKARANTKLVLKLRPLKTIATDLSLINCIPLLEISFSETGHPHLPHPHHQIHHSNRRHHRHRLHHHRHHD